MTPMLEAVIFDMDGVLVDSYRAHFLSWRQIAAEAGLPLPVVAPWLGAAPGTSPMTWYVDPSGTIQAAIDAATAGDTINALAGTYEEQLHIAKDLDPDLQELLGYTMGNYALGYYSDPERVREVADTLPPELALGRKPRQRADGSALISGEI